MKELKGWQKTILFISVVLLIIPFLTFFPEKKEKLKLSRPAVVEKQKGVATVCAQEYNFTDARLPSAATVRFRADCETKVVLPPLITYRTDPTVDAQIRFVDGSTFIDGPERTVWYDMRRGVFWVRGTTSDGSMKISMEKTS